MRVLNNNVGISNSGVGVCNSGVCVCDIMANMRDIRVCVDREFDLGVNSWRWPHRKNGTHVKDVEDPIEV